MSAEDNPNAKSILMVVANPSVSEITGWPIGFWWAELTHPYWEFIQRGHKVTIVSPLGGDLEADAYSDPEHESGYSADDFVSLGFKKSPRAALLKGTKSIKDIKVDDFDAIFLVGGQSPMYTFFNNEELHHLFASFYEKGKVASAVCHATSILLKAKTLDGRLLAAGKRWTGFTSAEEEYVEQALGQKIQPFWIEGEAAKIPDTTFVAGPARLSHAVVDGNLVTGQQHYSGSETAQAVLTCLER